MTARISVIVTSYNQRAFLAEAIDSVLAQTRAADEIVVADDGSTDGSHEMLRDIEARHNGRVIPVLSTANRGIPENRNAGLARATGDYVAVLDGDDRLLPDNLERQAEALLANPQAGCAYTNLYFIDAAGNRLSVRDSGPRESGDVFVDVACVGMGHLRSMLMRRDLVMSTGGFYGRFPKHDGYVMTLRLARRSPFVYVPEPLAEKRQHAGGDSRTFDEAARLGHLRAVYRHVLWLSLPRGPRDWLKIRRAWLRKLASVEAAARAEQGPRADRR